MDDRQITDAAILAQAREAGLQTQPPFDAEILRSVRHLQLLAARSAQRWTWADEPAYRFVPADAQDAPAQPVRGETS